MSTPRSPDVSSRGSEFGYQPGLDGLRAIAVVLVLVFHSGLNLLPGGFLGVSVFFTISGFLITSLILNEYERDGRVDLASFWVRRFRRLLPASLVVIIGVCIGALWLSTSVEASRVRGDALSAVFYVSNWRFIYSHLSYQQIFSTASPLVHLWSLSIEEQMYVAIPIVVALCAWVGMHRRMIGVVLTIGAVISTLIGAFLVSGDRLYYGTDTRAAELLIGAAAAALIGPKVMFASRAKTQGTWTTRILGLTSIAVIVALARWSSTTSTWVYAGLLPGFALVSLTAVICVQFPGPLRTLLSTGLLRRIGRISYGLYLFHWPIFTWVNQERVRVGGWALFGLRLVITGLVTVISYFLIEQPFRQRRLAPDTRTFLLVMAAAGAIAVAVPVLGLESVSSTPVTDVQILSTLPPANDGPSDNGQPLRILVIGDSTAENVARALATQESIGVISGGILGCPLIAVKRVFDTPRSSQEATYCPDNLGVVESHVDFVDLVLIVGGVSNQWAYEPRDPVQADLTVVPGSDQYIRDFDSFMVGVQDVVARRGVPIIVFDNPLTRPDDNVLGDELAAHGAWRSEIERWSQEWKTVEVFGFDELLARADSDQGRRERPDGVHLEEEFARELARTTLVPRLRAMYGTLVHDLGDSGCRIRISDHFAFALDRCHR